MEGKQGATTMFCWYDATDDAAQAPEDGLIVRVNGQTVEPIQVKRGDLIWPLVGQDRT